MAEYTLFVRMKIHEHKVDDFVKLMHEITLKTKDEPGCLVFEMRRDPLEPNTFIVFESFVDKAAFDVHDVSDYHKGNGDALRAAIADLEMREIESVGYSAELLRRQERRAAPE